LLDVFKGGALAEYVTVSEKDIALKPSSLSFEHAATLPVAGSAALQILNAIATVKSRSEVLINGATGGIGMFLTQLAKQQGAIVTSVVSSRGVELARKWKSDFVFDYGVDSVLLQEKKYDVVVDLSGKMPFRMAKSIMKNSAVYVNTTPGPKEIISSTLNNLFSSKKYRILFLEPSAHQLATIAEKASSGVDIVIHSVWNLSEFKKAYQSTMKSGALGKVVITIS
jgi:NADPH:quinone reductase-like Zn-dependent oxidoreductase